MGRAMKIVAVIAVVLVVSGGVGMMALRERDATTSGSVSSVPAYPGTEAPLGAPVGYTGDVAAAPSMPEADKAYRTAAETAVPQDATLEGIGGGGTAPDAVGTTPKAPAQIIKTADLSLVVAKDGFNDAFDRAALVAKTYDGFVVDSSTNGTKSRAGSLLIRVPVANFDQAVSDLRAIGTDVERETMSGQDVTDQFVDLGARQRSWEAQERVLVKLMDQANSINETMQIQNEIQRVQYEIESIKGQLRMLRDQAGLSTIAVALHEPGTPVGTTDDPKPSLADAWDKAVAGTLGVLSAVIVGLGYVLPLALIGLVGWGVVRRVRNPRGRRPQQPQTDPIA